MPYLAHKTILVIGAVVEIAMHSGEEWVSALTLADRLGLAKRQLEPALQALVRKGILEGRRGRRAVTSLPKLVTPSLLAI
jgi:Rrf2 family transcriptional regulator, iron-sulfur cluster assembly transcription factor